MSSTDIVPECSLETVFCPVAQAVHELGSVDPLASGLTDMGCLSNASHVTRLFCLTFAIILF